MVTIISKDGIAEAAVCQSKDFGLEIKGSVTWTGDRVHKAVLTVHGVTVADSYFRTGEAGRLFLERNAGAVREALDTSKPWGSPAYGSEAELIVQNALDAALGAFGEPEDWTRAEHKRLRLLQARYAEML
jgi:hypothetical protein